VDPQRRVLGGGSYSEWNRSPVAQSQWVAAKEATVLRSDPSSANLIVARESPPPIKTKKSINIATIIQNILIFRN